MLPASILYKTKCQESKSDRDYIKQNVKSQKGIEIFPFVSIFTAIKFSVSLPTMLQKQCPLGCLFNGIVNAPSVCSLALSKLCPNELRLK